ncbi:hypothetical protein [Methylobacterium sp. ID0610]|uniref:hypothetical protein n=1 Tax=Methylobacterium carpenticola TaxID=3344827 RepID=UPI0036B89C47
MKRTTLGLAAALVLGGLGLGAGSASAASVDAAVNAPTAYVQMTRGERHMMRHRMMRREMHHRRMMHRHHMMHRRMHRM